MHSKGFPFACLACSFQKSGSGIFSSRVWSMQSYSTVPGVPCSTKTLWKGALYAAICRQVADLPRFGGPHSNTERFGAIERLCCCCGFNTRRCLSAVSIRTTPPDHRSDFLLFFGITHFFLSQKKADVRRLRPSKPQFRSDGRHGA